MKSISERNEQKNCIFFVKSNTERNLFQLHFHVKSLNKLAKKPAFLHEFENSIPAKNVMKYI